MLFTVRNLILPFVKVNNLKMCSALSSTAAFKEQKIKVDKWDINYLKVGNGPHTLLCMPGALGSIWTDFKPQVEGINREQFTIIAWDPPGYGKSRPPERVFPADFYEKDADYAFQFMKALNIPKYSVLGWSDGGTSSLIFAAKYPDVVNKLVVTACNSLILPHELDIYKSFRKHIPYTLHDYLIQALNIPKYSVLGWSDGGTSSLILAAKYPHVVNKLVVTAASSLILPHELDIIKKIRDINTWSKRMRDPMIALYGEEVFRKLWSDWVDGMINVYNAKNGDICSTVLKDIKCPTLIIYGQKDPMVDSSHVSHMHTHIQGSRIHLYPDGKHNIHLAYADDFNKRVEEFLLQGTSKI